MLFVFLISCLRILCFLSKLNIHANRALTKKHNLKSYLNGAFKAESGHNPYRNGNPNWSERLLHPSGFIEPYFYLVPAKYMNPYLNSLSIIDL